MAESRTSSLRLGGYCIPTRQSVHFHYGAVLNKGPNVTMSFDHRASTCSLQVLDSTDRKTANFSSFSDSATWTSGHSLMGKNQV